MVTKQNSKTSGEECDCSLRVIGFIETDNRITAILACLRGGIAGIYAQKKLDELDKKLETQDWDNFVKEIKLMFSNKMKAADVE